MAAQDPVPELDAPFSSPDATATPWADARSRLERAEIYWLSTVRPDGRPHVTPMVAVWLDGALFFSTGAQERKARNLEQNPRVVVTTGRNVLSGGLDVVVEGDAERVGDEPTLQRVAERYNAKYEVPFRFQVRDGVLHGEEDPGEGPGAVVFRVAPAKVFGYGRGEAFSATRYRF